MKKPFDLLATDREPFFLIEKAIVNQRDGILFTFSKEEGERQIPVAKYLTLFLGHGSSITHQAALLCAQHDTHVAFVRGGVNLHSYWMGGRWQDPRRIVKQATLIESSSRRLNAAKFLLSTRIQRTGFRLEDLGAIPAASSIESLMGIEGNWNKALFRSLARERGIDFKRDKKSVEGVNGKLSLLSNLLYGHMTSLCLANGLHPSLGIMHGKSRRGGLAFDLADILKPELVIREAFHRPTDSNGKSMRRLSLKFSEKRFVLTKEVFSWINTLLNEDFE